MKKIDIINLIKEREEIQWRRYKVNAEYFGEDSAEAKEASAAWSAIFTLKCEIESR